MPWMGEQRITSLPRTPSGCLTQPVQPHMFTVEKKREDLHNCMKKEFEQNQVRMGGIRGSMFCVV